MDEESQTISVSPAERAAIFQGGRALCLILAAVVATAEIMVGAGLPDRSHGLMLAGIILLVGYAMLSWHGDRSLIRTRELLDEMRLILAEVHLVREQGEERAAEMRKIEGRVTKLVEVAVATLSELVKTVDMHGKAMVTMHDDLDKLTERVDASIRDKEDRDAELLACFDDLAQRVDTLEASRSGNVVSMPRQARTRKPGEPA